MVEGKIPGHYDLFEEEKTRGIVSSSLFYHLVIYNSSAGDSLKAVSEKGLIMPSGKKLTVIVFNCLMLLLVNWVRVVYWIFEPIFLKCILILIQAHGRMEKKEEKSDYVLPGMPMHLAQLFITGLWIPTTVHPK